MERHSPEFDKFVELCYSPPAMLLPRFYQNLENWLEPGRVLILYGPRQVGKTTLVKNFLGQTNLKYKLDSGENISARETLSSQDFKRILEYVEGYDLIILDEAQHIPNIGLGLKIIVDQAPHIKVLATGSSSFDLAQQTGEPLTGRKRTLLLYPLSQLELLNLHNRFELKQKIEDFLIFGGYPMVLVAEERKKKIEFLKDLVDSYLLRDVLAFERIRGAKKLLNLLRLLAFQVGNLVSLNELGQQLEMDTKTVDRYLDLLEKSFVIKSVGSFSRNLRNEIKQKCKYYFLDLGVRNAIISQFNSLELRKDVGQLWENFIVIERLKKQAYKNIYANNYFWRTYDQKEIDWVEEREGELLGYEIKWGKDKVKPPKDWLGTYDSASFEVINPENYLDFIA
jgi:predicted AAA+ superfamily ATPase